MPIASISLKTPEAPHALSVRRDGFATCLGEYDYSNGVSAAVFDVNHRPIAIVNIWGPSLRVTSARLPALGRAALRAAHEMSLLLA